MHLSEEVCGFLSGTLGSDGFYTFPNIPTATSQLETNKVWPTVGDKRARISRPPKRKTKNVAFPLTPPYNCKVPLQEPPCALRLDCNKFVPKDLWPTYHIETQPKAIPILRDGG
jgi:hypothetical protein